MSEKKMIVRDDGAREWYLNGELHRTDGPATEWLDGSRSWWLNGKLHRTDGPAIEWADGSRLWYLNGKRHREDGPARECASGSREWYFMGISIQVDTLEEFKEAIRLLPEGNITK